jgi:hypothetical protein
MNVASPEAVEAGGPNAAPSTNTFISSIGPEISPLIETSSLDDVHEFSRERNSKFLNDKEMDELLDVWIE